ncbi:MAG: hypothetical protein Ct9H90mP10_00430 [Actinomycetota bacterium]|nr:MAG: hypothetical protein Ct9H90mP10_00430 [Actinomycetota bacterium]
MLDILGIYQEIQKTIPSAFKKEDILWGAVKPENYENIYVIPEDRKKIVNELKGACRQSTRGISCN